MTGTIGSGKTTFAKKLSKNKKSVIFLIDHSIRQLGVPIKSVQDYDQCYQGVTKIISDLAIQILKLGQSVVLDFGGNVGQWDWLSAISDQGKANIEIFHLMAPIETRKRRVLQRNMEPEEFKFSEQEFASMPTVSAAPDVKREGLKITLVNTVD